MLIYKLGHFEHGNLRFTSENSLELVISVDHTLVFLVLKAVLFNVRPKLFNNIRAGHGS